MSLADDDFYQDEPSSGNASGSGTGGPGFGPSPAEDPFAAANTSAGSGSENFDIDRTFDWPQLGGIQGLPPHEEEMARRRVVGFVRQQELFLAGRAAQPLALDPWAQFIHDSLVQASQARTAMYGLQGEPVRAGDGGWPSGATMAMGPAMSDNQQRYGYQSNGHHQHHHHLQHHASMGMSAQHHPYPNHPSPAPFAAAPPAWSNQSHPQHQAPYGYPQQQAQAPVAQAGWASGPTQLPQPYGHPQAVDDKSHLLDGLKSPVRLSPAPQQPPAAPVPAPAAPVVEHVETKEDAASVLLAIKSGGSTPPSPMVPQARTARTRTRTAELLEAAGVIAAKNMQHPAERLAVRIREPSSSPAQSHSASHSPEAREGRSGDEDVFGPGQGQGPSQHRGQSQAPTSAHDEFEDESDDESDAVEPIKDEDTRANVDSSPRTVMRHGPSNSHSLRQSYSRYTSLVATPTPGMRIPIDSSPAIRGGDDLEDDDEEDDHRHRSHHHTGSPTKRPRIMPGSDDRHDSASSQLGEMLPPHPYSSSSATSHQVSTPAQHTHHPHDPFRGLGLDAYALESGGSRKYGGGRGGLRSSPPGAGLFSSPANPHLSQQLGLSMAPGPGVWNGRGGGGTPVGRGGGGKMEGKWTPMGGAGGNVTKGGRLTLGAGRGEEL